MDFSLNVTDQDALKKEIVAEVKPVPEEEAKLRALAESNVAEIINVGLEPLEKKKEVIKSIESFGLDTIQNSAKKNSLLQVSVGNFSKMGDEGGSVANGLVDLQRELKDLDPSLIDFTKTGVLGKIFNPIRAYFAKYQKADNVISDIVESLNKGQVTLQNDNTTLEIEQDSLKELTKKLAKEIELGYLMDEAIEKKVVEMKANNEDNEKLKFVSEEIQFPLRQRLMDLQQMVIVNHQGIMAIEVVRRNNKELIRGVERAKTVTISAMRIAATVASALYNQKIVLKKIEMLNAVTNDLISGTARMLKEQGAEIQKQSMEANISVDTLKTSFADVMAAMDAISTYKQEALPKMKETINQFRELVTKGDEQVAKLEKGNKIQ